MSSFIHAFIHSSIIPSFVHRVPCAHEPKPRTLIYQNPYICMVSKSVHFVDISALFWKNHIQAVSSPSSQKSPSSCHHLDHTHLGSPVGFRIQWPTVLMHWMARSCVLGEWFDVMYFFFNQKNGKFNFLTPPSQTQHIGILDLMECCTKHSQTRTGEAKKNKTLQKERHLYTSSK